MFVMNKSYFVVLFLLMNELSSKVRFKAKVFKDPFKIKRLAKFKIGLCSDIDDLINLHQSALLKYAINKFFSEYRNQKHNPSKHKLFAIKDKY